MDLTNTKSLIGSKTFWTLLLGLISYVATTYHLTALASWAADPHTLDSILHVVTIASFFGGFVFRSTATSVITSIFPK